MPQQEISDGVEAKKASKHRPQTAHEELANSLSHGFGLLLSIIGLVNLVMVAFLRGNAIDLVVVNVFCGSTIILYASSTVYHAVVDPKLKHVCRILDHTSIYILIAGTYTPVSLLMLPPAWGWTLFGVIWGLALFGVVFKLFFTGRFDKVSTIVYLLMGWMALVAIKPLIDHMPIGGLLLMLAGGLSYSLGVIFYRMDKMLYSHTIWHGFVLGGTICHYLMIAIYCMP
ncbi:MAG TPA: hemolysin III family protein [Bacteroidia bacterium]|nr:hemolysin III family protein [Bacteroidia bacterium]